MYKLLRNVNTILLLLVIIITNVYAQLTPQSLTNYKSERKSLNFVDQYDEFLLVENDDILTVLSVNDEGKLYKIYDSKIPYCHDPSIRNVVINNEYILYYYGSHIILENFLTGHNRKVENLKVSDVDNYSRANFLNNFTYVIKGDSNYVFDLMSDSPIKITNAEYIPTKGFVYYIDRNDQTVIEFFQQKKSISFQNTSFAKSSNLFDGLIFQKSVNNEWSTQNHIYLVNINGIVDTIVDNFPIFDIIDKNPLDHHLLMGKLDFFENKLYMYKYNLETKTLSILDSLSEYNDYNGYFVNDSLFYYDQWGEYNFYNFQTKNKKTLNICNNYYLRKYWGNIFYFDNFGSAPLVYDYKLDKVSKLINEPYEDDVYFTHVKKGEKLYLTDLQYLNFPYYELGDSVVTRKHQNILLDADNTGMRTSQLKESKNYLFTFDDEDIVVIDTTEINGYRKKKLIDHASILGTLKGINWIVYEDSIFGVIPIIKNTKKYFDLIKVNLKDLTITNISEKFNWMDTTRYCYSGSPIYPGNYYSNDFLVLDKRLLNMKTNETFIIPDSLLLPPYRSIYGVRLLGNKLVIFNEKRILEFSYPEFKHLRSIDINRVMYNSDTFHIYSKNDNENLILSDGVKDEVIPDTEGFKSISSYGLNQEDAPFVLINTKTKKLRIYNIVRNTNGNNLVEKVFEDDYTGSHFPAQTNSTNYMAFSFNQNEDVYTYFFDLKSKITYRIEGIDNDDIFHYNGVELICIDNKKRQIKKLDLNGNILKTIPYPDHTDFVYNLRALNFGHAGLFVFDRYDNRNNNSKLFFDAVLFDFVFDTECRREYFRYSSLGGNVIYKDDAYYFNAELDGRGRQIYKFQNINPDGQTPTFNYNNEQISIYPNPANDWLEIKMENLCDINSIKIFDLIGNTQLINQSSCQSHINISNLKQGTFLMQVTFGKNTKTLKFVKI